MKNLLPILLFASIFFLFQPASAAPLATCLVPSQYATIGAATGDIDCDIIKIAAGTYPERISISRNLSLEGEQSSNTIIDGGSLGGVNGSTIRIGGNLSVALKNITVQNGLANRGGGLYVESGANVSTSEVVFKNNRATSEGGHVYAAGGVTLLSVTLQGGQAPNGGGIFANSGTLSLTNFVIESNEATTNGGGIFGNDAVRLTDGIIRDNRAGQNGAGVFAKGNVDLIEVNASGNVATGDGGAIYTENANTKVTNTGDRKLTGNQATNGGAVFGFEGNVEIKGVDITYNNASANGGGIFVSGTGGRRAITVKYENGSLIGNDANIGGAIEVNGTATVQINSAVLLDNKAREGAGINMAGGAPSLTINGTTFDNNNATEDGGGAGGGIRANGQANIVLSNSILQNNDASGNGGGIAALNSGITLSIFRSQFLNNGAASGGGLYATGNGLTIDKVVFANNRANADGGGVYLDGTGNSILNSTFSSNSANGSGKGSAIFARAMRIDFTTIAFNTGATAVWKESNATTLFLNNSILHNPAVSNCGGSTGQINGSTSIDSDSSCGLSAANGNSSSNPQLDATLQNNGGNTLTHAISASSPANNTGANCTSVDQRNITRNDPCDRGAFELTSGSPTAITVASAHTVSHNRLLPYAMLILVFTLSFWCYWLKYRPIKNQIPQTSI